MGNTQILQLRDTIRDTKKIFVPMNTKISIRTKPDKEGKCIIYLSVTHNKKRERINLDLKINPKKFDKEKECILGNSPEDRDMQLILDNTLSKVTQIKTYYRLANRILTLEKFVEEFKNNVPRGEFTSFFEYEVKKDRSTLKPKTYKRYVSVLNNLREFKKEIYYSEIDEYFFTSYKAFFLAPTKQRKARTKNTYFGNIRVIKKYLKRSQKVGIKLSIDIENLIAPQIRGKRIHLQPEELKRLYNYYFSEFILPGEQIALGTFLFSCFTSLRISELNKLNREQILSGVLEYKADKTDKDNYIKINNKAMSIVNHHPELFSKRIAEQTMNKVLKTIAGKNNIKKTLSLHVGRHTFATNYLRAGGKVEMLQILMKHTDIKETMGYVHIVDQENDDSIMLLDRLF